MRQLKISQSITERTDETLEAYLNDISKKNTVTPNEEVELARRIHEGDKEALEKLVNANLRFVVSVAKQYRNQGLPLSDLISEGNIGLVKAAEKFDETKGFKFITFAVWWIRQSIMKAISEHGRVVRLPNNQNQFLLQIRKIERQYEQEENRPATIEEIAYALETDPEKVRNTLVAASRSMSLDAPVGDEEDTALVDLTTNPDAVQTDHTLDMESLNQTLDMVLKAALKERDIFIIKQTFGIGCPEKSQEEVSEMLGLTRERVRQIRERALHKLKKYKFLLCF